MRHLARSGIGACLHALIDQQVVLALARWEKRSAKGEAVDFTLNAKLPALPPDFCRIKGDVNDHPAEARRGTLEPRLEGFGNDFFE